MMMTKTREECLHLLAEAEQRINNSFWRTGETELTRVISHQDMQDLLLHYGLPMPLYVNDSYLCLPPGWLKRGHKDYTTVAAKFFEVYSNLRYRASIENNLMEMEYVQELQASYRECCELINSTL